MADISTPIDDNVISKLFHWLATRGLNAALPSFNAPDFEVFIGEIFIVCSGDQFELIFRKSHPLNIVLAHGASKYIGMASQGEGEHGNHAYLCRISNNNGLYTYDIYDSPQPPSPLTHSS